MRNLYIRSKSIQTKRSRIILLLKMNFKMKILDARRNSFSFFIRIREFKYFVKKKKEKKEEEKKNDTPTRTEFKRSGLILKFRNIYDSRKSFPIRFIAGALMILTSIQLTSDKSSLTDTDVAIVPLIRHRPSLSSRGETQSRSAEI